MTCSRVDDKFLAELKRKTEKLWRESPISGFQSPRGAQWYPGLSEQEIKEYEQTLGMRFPDDFRHMLRMMNGTYYPTGTPDPFAFISRQKAVFIYSYPRDIDLVRQRIEDLDLESSFLYLQNVLRMQNFDLEADAGLVPIYQHRYVVCSSDPATSTVLSIMGTDAIVYGNDLKEYLQREFLSAKSSA